MALKPRKRVPSLDLESVGSARFSLSEQRPERFTMLVFYRGLHCPVCRRYLTELDRLSSEFAERGVGVFAASADTRERAEQTRAEWGLTNLALGYGLPLEQARAWGLYVSNSRGKTSAGIEEPAQFSEPGLFLISPDRTLYWGSVSTMPFARPHFDEILAAVDFAVKTNYPARGEA